jgi:hypothetical protein
MGVQGVSPAEQLRCQELRGKYSKCITPRLLALSFLQGQKNPVGVGFIFLGISQTFAQFSSYLALFEHT